MRYNGSAWEYMGGSSNVSGYTSLALDATGRPYVANYGNSVTVMRYNGSSELETIGLAGFSASRAAYTSLVLDAAGRPYIAFQDIDNGYHATVMRAK